MQEEEVDRVAKGKGILKTDQAQLLCNVNSSNSKNEYIQQAKVLNND